MKSESLLSIARGGGLHGFTGSPPQGSQEKPKDKGAAQPKLASLSEAPQQAELIKKQRKPRWDEESGEG